MKRLPFFKLWCHRSVYRQHGWEIGFWFAPFPIEDQEPGMHVLALAFFEICTTPGRWPVFHFWSADPSLRPLPPFEQMDVDHPGFDPSQPLTVLLDGEKVANAMAYSVPHGWVEQLVMDGPHAGVRRQRVYGRVELRWV